MINPAREIYFMCELLSLDGYVKSKIDLLPGGAVTVDAGRVTTRTAKFSIRDSDAINWSRDLFRLTMFIDGEMHRLGVFVPSSPDKLGSFRSIDAYDQSLFLADDKIEEYKYFPSGQPYNECISDLLLSAGFVRSSIEITNETLPTEREFEVGTSKLSIINTLLSEINFEPIYADANGTMTAKKFIRYAERRVDHVYEIGPDSIIRPGLLMRQDFFGVPNVFVGIVSSPEMGPMRAVYRNDNPTSPTSTTARGRTITDVHKFDIVPSHGILEGLVERRAIEQSQVYMDIEFETAIMPGHSVRDVIELYHPDHGRNKYNEISWETPLAAGAPMKHKANRMVLI